ncbi:MAG: type II toxin-antitoxin system RelE/ParE family toxin [Capnocytophaga sp.]|nr:type II toxin-antitoxin system RelE/ParE family toxin [Capnocytophaga sp.]
MKIKWTEKALSEYLQTIDYWNNRNKSNEYSHKIEKAVNEELIEINKDPLFLSKYSEKLKMFRKIFFKGKFSLFYKVDFQESVIYITFFRSNKQKPIYITKQLIQKNNK